MLLSWACLCFAGHFRNKHNDIEKTNEETDIYDMIAAALQYGIRYSDLGNMSYTTLANILDAYMPKKKKPTQAQIELITQGKVKKQ